MNKDDILLEIWAAAFVIVAAPKTWAAIICWIAVVYYCIRLILKALEQEEKK